jgi:hypothetical protein
MLIVLLKLHITSGPCIYIMGSHDYFMHSERANVKMNEFYALHMDTLQALRIQSFSYSMQMNVLYRLYIRPPHFPVQISQSPASARIP